MSADSFFARWSQRNAEAAAARSAAVTGPGLQPDVQHEAQPGVPPAPPTLDDVARLTPDSDFTRFVARGVDESVKRSAMKKLFADPRFNVMDGLDVYIEDYNKFVPLTPAMLAMLNHAQALLDPLAHLETPLMRLLDAADESPPERAALLGDEQAVDAVPADAQQSRPDDAQALAQDIAQDIDHRGAVPPSEEPSTDDNPV